MFYVLMTHKSAECYDSVFEYIRNNIFDMKPKEFMSDWEAGLRKSLRTNFPGIVLRGCWFHLKRAVWLKVVKLNLKRFIKENIDAAKLVTKLTNLSLLPMNQIPKGFKHIKEQAKKIGVDQEMNKLFDYFEQTWHVKVTIQKTKLNHIYRDIPDKFIRIRS